MKVAALTSGGKDSVYAAYLAGKMGHHIEYLLCMRPDNPESYMFHHPNIDFVSLQAESMGVPLIYGRTAGVKEDELSDLKALISQVANQIDGVVTGALASNYQKKRIGDICDELGLECINPLWHADPLIYWKNLLSEGFKVLIAAVAAEGLDERWLGKVIDESSLRELLKISEKYQIHLGFEGGEAETFVLDCPMFSKPITVVDAETVWGGSSGKYLIKQAKLKVPQETF